MFIREGTPRGLSTISRGVPSARKGISSGGRILGNDTLVTVTARHLIADRNFSLLSDINADDLVNAGHRARRPFSLGEYAGHRQRCRSRRAADAERGIADLSRLLAEDRAEQSLLCGQLGLALGRYLADEYIAGSVPLRRCE